MERISKISFIMLALMLSIFVAAGSASAAICCSPSGDCTAADAVNCPGGAAPGACPNGATGYAPGDVVTYTAGEVVFTASVTVPVATRHGLIIGAAGVTINGCENYLSGTTVVGRHCEVNVAPEDDPDRLWCVGHPCRCADVIGGDDDPTTMNGCLDSGIMNAVVPGAAGSGCIVGAPACQGGCDHLTVKNLEINNWCDGIFVSGQCYDKWPDNTGIDPVPTEVRITGLLIEGNKIQNCGQAGCGTYTPAAGGDGGDWDLRFYNDAIFTAQVGVDSSNCSQWAQFGDGLPAETSEPYWCSRFDWWKVRCDGCTCEPQAQGCDECDCYFSLHKLHKPWNVENVELNRIIHNEIYDQKGCGCIACPGGMGINLQGGLEVDPVFWSGANVIAKNQIKNCAMSGICYHHATRHNRIHDNLLVQNQYGGITNGCAWCNENYIWSNKAEHNSGMGIGVASKATIANNYCVETHPVTDPNLLLLGWPSAGHGIVIGGDAGGSEVVDNVVCTNMSADILDASGGAVGEENQCDDSAGFTPGCQYTNCDSFYSLCFADTDLNGFVNMADFNILNGEWGNTPAQCCPTN